MQANDLEPRHIGRVLSGRAVLLRTGSLTGPSASMSFLHGRLAWVAAEDGGVGSWIVLGFDNLAAPVYVPADALLMIEAADDEADDDEVVTCIFGCNGAQIMAGHRPECPDHIPATPTTPTERHTP